MLSIVINVNFIRISDHVSIIIFLRNENVVFCLYCYIEAYGYDDSVSSWFGWFDDEKKKTIAHSIKVEHN